MVGGLKSKLSIACHALETFVLIYKAASLRHCFNVPYYSK